MQTKPYMVIQIEVTLLDIRRAQLTNADALMAYLAKRGLLLEFPVVVSQAVDRDVHCYRQVIPREVVA